METRKIIIVNNKTQSQKTIMSTATTLAELKSEATAAGLDIEDMTWYEGHLRAELKDDSAELPKVVMWRGQETTDLTFLLTQPEKKVKSGALSRADLYNYIRNNNLQEVCKEVYDKNFTICSNDELLDIIKHYEDSHKCNCSVKKEEPAVSNLELAFEALIGMLAESYIITYSDRDYLEDVISGTIKPNDNEMTSDEIEEMFAFINK